MFTLNVKYTDSIYYLQLTSYIEISLFNEIICPPPHVKFDREDAFLLGGNLKDHRDSVLRIFLGMCFI